jgi:hypothetical protein
MVIKRVGAVSIAKIAGVIYAGMGLLIGAVFSLIGMLGLATRLASNDSGGAMFGALFGIGAIIILPICYGIMGFIGTLIAAGLFNLAAGMTGGVELEVQ